MTRYQFNWAADIEPELPAFWLNVLKDAQLNPEWARSMILTVVLAEGSSTCMYSADVLQPDHQRCGLGLITFVNGEPGVGKSPVFDIFHPPMMEHCAAEDIRYEAALTRYNCEMRIWSLKDKGLAKAIGKAVQGGQPDDELLEEMLKHENAKPVEPREDRMLAQAMSFSGFMKRASGKHKRLFIAHHDARTVVEKGGMFDKLDAFCTAWDYNETFMLNTAYKQLEFSDLRLATLLMIQPDYFSEFIERHDGIARGSGFMARCLITSVKRNQDRDPIDDQARSGEYLRQFLGRLGELHADASTRRARDDYSRSVLTFSAQATVLWNSHRRVVELESRSGGKFSDIDDFMKKYMNNVSRIAGIFHIIEGQDGEISYGNLRAAIAVMLFYATEYQNIYHPIDSHPKSVLDAWRVLNYMYHQYWTEGSLQAAYNDVLQSRVVREGVRHLDAAINHLVAKSYVRVDKSERKKFIQLDGTAFRRLTSECLESPMPTHFYSHNRPTFFDSGPSQMRPLLPIGQIPKTNMDPNC